MFYTDVIASARFETDQTGSDQGGDDAELIQALKEDYPALVRRVAKIVPDYYTFQTEGDLTASPTNPVGPYVQIRRIERLVGDRWVFVPPADPNRIGNPDRISWRAIGSNIELLPPTTDSTTRVRIEYIPPEVLPNASTHLKLPEGLEGCLVQMLAMRIRRRLDQNSSRHEAEYARIWNEVTVGLLPTTAQPRHISDYSADEGY